MRGIANNIDGLELGMQLLVVSRHIVAGGESDTG